MMGKEKNYEEVKEENRARALAAEKGIRLFPMHFSASAGRKLFNIISQSGKVYKPNVYDIPQKPYHVTAFALNLILAMIDRQQLTVGPHGHFITEEERVKYRAMTLDLLRNLEWEGFTGTKIEYIR